MCEIIVSDYSKPFKLLKDLNNSKLHGKSPQKWSERVYDPDTLQYSNECVGHKNKFYYLRFLLHFLFTVLMSYKLFTSERDLIVGINKHTSAHCAV